MKVFNNKPLHIITYGCAMAQASLSLKAWVQPQESPRGVAVDKLSLAQGLLRYISFPVPLSNPQSSILIHLSITNT